MAYPSFLKAVFVLWKGHHSEKNKTASIHCENKHILQSYSPFSIIFQLKQRPSPTQSAGRPLKRSRTITF